MKTWLNVKIKGDRIAAAAVASLPYESPLHGPAAVTSSVPVEVPPEVAAALKALLEAATPALAKKADHDRAVHIVHEAGSRKGLLRRAAEAVGLAKE